MAQVDEHRFGRESAITLTSGDLSVTFLPDLGMTGVSLRYREREHLALPGGLDALMAGKTAGLPLLAPWANRLSARRYRVGDRDVDLTGLPIGTDDNGLPIHGFLVGSRDWHSVRGWAEESVARARAVIDVDAPAFPFPHTIRLDVAVWPERLEIATAVHATGTSGVPLAFGWHPYLQLEGTARSRWRLRLPDRRHLELDERGIPTGVQVSERAEDAPIGRRRFDDLYRLGADGELAFVGEDGSAVELRCDHPYRFAQVWVPPGRAYGALEPMIAPTDALVAGTAPILPPGDTQVAKFALTLRGPQ